MTANSPTWGEVRRFLAADGWREIRPGERGGRRSRHVFFEKVLPDGRVLRTHVSHSSQKRVSAGRFRAILRHELEVTAADFWEAVRTGKPVERPAQARGPEELQHPAWVVHALLHRLDMSPTEVAQLDPAEAERLALDSYGPEQNG